MAALDIMFVFSFGDAVLLRCVSTSKLVSDTRRQIKKIEMGNAYCIQGKNCQTDYLWEKIRRVAHFQSYLVS